MCAPPPFSRLASCSRKTRSRSFASPFLPLKRLAILGFSFCFLLFFFFFFKILFLRDQHSLWHFWNGVQRCLCKSRIAKHSLKLREGIRVTGVRDGQHHHAECRRRGRRHAVFIGH